MREALIAHYICRDSSADRARNCAYRVYAISNELGLLIPWSQVRVLLPAPEEELLKPF